MQRYCSPRDRAHQRAAVPIAITVPAVTIRIEGELPSRLRDLVGPFIDSRGRYLAGWSNAEGGSELALWAISGGAFVPIEVPPALASSAWMPTRSPPTRCSSRRGLAARPA